MLQGRRIVHQSSQGVHTTCICCGNVDAGVDVLVPQGSEKLDEAKFALKVETCSASGQGSVTGGVSQALGQTMTGFTAAEYFAEDHETQQAALDDWIGLDSMVRCKIDPPNLYFIEITSLDMLESKATEGDYSSSQNSNM